MEVTSVLWSMPFLGIIFSMSCFPLLCPRLWSRCAGYVPLFWISVYVLAVGGFLGVAHVIPAICEPIITDYLPFIILISALYIVSGGIFISFSRGHGPIFNTAYLFVGSIIAGWIGTTGAAALLIRPFLRANQGRKYTVHLMVFFIFLVANVGGAATPLGDPPLFIGFLKGVDFFWFIRHLFPILFGTITVLCGIFFLLDLILFRLDLGITYERSEGPFLQIQGMGNVILIVMILLVVIFCNFDGAFILYGERFSYASILRNTLLAIISLVSLKITPTEIRRKNDFSFAPIREIAELFAGIFITVAPIIDMLHRGPNGEFGWIFEWIAPGGEFLASRCFWASGILSAILDNAPTFLIFFHLTSGDPHVLMTLKSNILMAFSISTVFMGALTYIGNAPNLIVKSISVNHGVRVPSFMGYMKWSCLILLPIFVVISQFLK
ncbi:MAG: sodium:proton antiporter [Holosporaceae bacterium]|nr:sodium:proton antiporter [Holosporaceae bacterium]